MPAKCASCAASVPMRFTRHGRSDHCPSHVHTLLSPSLHGSLTLIWAMRLPPAERLSRHSTSKGKICAHTVGLSFLQSCLCPWVKHVLAKPGTAEPTLYQPNLVQSQPTSEVHEQEINAHFSMPSFSLLSLKTRSEMCVSVHSVVQMHNVKQSASPLWVSVFLFCKTGISDWIRGFWYLPST